MDPRSVNLPEHLVSVLSKQEQVVELEEILPAMGELQGLRVGNERRVGKASPESALDVARNKLYEQLPRIGFLLQRGDDRRFPADEILQLMCEDPNYRKKLYILGKDHGFSRQEVSWQIDQLKSIGYRLCERIFPGGLEDVYLLLKGVDDGQDNMELAGYPGPGWETVEDGRFMWLTRRAASYHIIPSIYLALMLVAAGSLSAALRGNAQAQAMWNPN